MRKIKGEWPQESAPLNSAPGSAGSSERAGTILQRFASEHRMYSVMLKRDLFGDWVVVQSWGGRFSGRGGGMTQVVARFEEGIALLQKISQRRQQRGYLRIA
mgnify:CR=1 FL=1